MPKKTKNLQIVEENSTPFYLYKNDIGDIPSKTMKVFYNKKMILNRDITSLCINLYRELYHQEDLTVVDTMAASGISSIRLLNECNNIKRIYINDLNPLAVGLIKKNLELNNLNKSNTEILVSRNDANFLLAEIVNDIYKNSKNTLNYPNVISIDPFGTPNSYLDSAIKAIAKKNGLLCITATDTAVLFGMRSKACIRKYMSKPLNCEFTKEIGARILLYFISRIANINDIGILPLLTFYSKHFIRVFALTFHNKKKISEFFDHFGYGFYCPLCGYRKVIKNNEIFHYQICKLCSNDDLRYFGPIWISEIHDKKFVNELRNKIQEYRVENKSKIEKILEMIEDETFMPNFYYNTHKVARKLKLHEIPKITHIIKTLKERGYKATRTHFDFQSIKSDANINEISNVMKDLIN